MQGEHKAREKLKRQEQEFERAMSDLRRILIDALRHGFFDGSITIETRKADKRELLIKAGKSYKFTIPLDELPR